ncbi:TetR/AcrR family transcriptional regulator [Pseudomonas fakonensis]|uniref:TetR/AcrR family transcriptional regulator n=1 Tax=Pseudomonas fakonensis TaxID=2842355 RepID=A0ABX8MZB2_9PSED|nr:TetR/AcrR family transcriptional regulator [Pseudomonas fakonensis]QXH49477.1 TetR/AcrR family transcriptional regulator [Pseudomonas fakonensis]
MPPAPRKDGEATRLRILDTAGELFAAQGFAASSNKAVAAQAEVDLASINYHFGSRNGLYLAVLDEARRRFLDITNLQRIVQAPVPASDKLRTLIELVVQKAGSGREGWHLRVLAAELLTPSSQGQAHLQGTAPQKLALLMGLFSEISGIPAGDPALVRCILCVTAPWAMLLIGPRGGSGAVQQILGMPHAEVCDQLYRFALVGLQDAGRHLARH